MSLSKGSYHYQDACIYFRQSDDEQSQEQLQLSRQSRSHYSACYISLHIIIIKSLLLYSLLSFSVRLCDTTQNSQSRETIHIRVFSQ